MKFSKVNDKFGKRIDRAEGEVTNERRTRVISPHVNIYKQIGNVVERKLLNGSSSSSQEREYH